MICRRCGCEFDARRYRRADDSVRCPDCGAVYRRSPQGAARPRRDAIPARPAEDGNRYAGRSKEGSVLTKKLWKLPVWAWGVILVVILAAAFGGGASREATVQPARVPSSDVQVQAAANAPAAAPEENSMPLGLSADFGSSRIEVVSAAIRTVGGDKYVICEYNWTNNTGDNAMFLTEISEHAFQNGVALESGYLLDVEGNTLTEVMSGYSLAVRTVYKLSDPAAEIAFSVEPFMDLTDSYAPLTFTVNPA